MSIKRRRPKVNASDHKIGYGKAPRHSRFKPGQTGNPKGRPKGVRNFKTLVMNTLKAPVKVTSEGKSRKVSTLEATLLRLREKAVVGGNLRAIDRLLQLAQTYCQDELSAAIGLSIEDENVLRIYRERVLSGAAHTPELVNGKDGSNSDKPIVSTRSLEESPSERGQVERYRPTRNNPSADDADQDK